MKRIKTPLTGPVIRKLKCGEEVLLSGTLYTARDQAHKELAKLIREKKRLPFDLKDAVIYYAGPTPGRAKGIFGSCGPTTSSRMDKFTPALLGKDLRAMIGKGNRAKPVRDLIKRKKCVYFLAIGGAGAYLAKRIKSAALIAFKKLGPEAIYKLEVKDFPLIVGIDSNGRSVYK
jgi:fumarate hydratase subunit beta